MFLSVDIPKLPENTISTAHQNSVGADLSMMESDTNRMRLEKPWVFSNLKEHKGLPEQMSGLLLTRIKNIN